MRKLWYNFKIWLSKGGNVIKLGYLVWSASRPWTCVSSTVHSSRFIDYIMCEKFYKSWCSEKKNRKCEIQCLLGIRFTNPGSSWGLPWYWIKINFQKMTSCVTVSVFIYPMNAKRISTVFCGSDLKWTSKKRCYFLRDLICWNTETN